MFRVDRATVACAIALGTVLSLIASAAAEPVALVLKTGTPMHVALDRRVTMSRVGQVITGTLVEPVYAYDRVVLPAGSAVRGHVAALEPPSGGARLRSYLSADFSPHRHVVLQFDTVTLDDGREIEIHTIVTEVTERATLRVAAATEPSGVTARVRQEIAERTSEAIETIKGPDKMERVKDALLERLPYHKQFLRKGTVLTAELQAPVDFGKVEGTPRAAPGTQPAAESILSARLLTTLDSRRTTRGETVQAVVTHPVFSAARELILPEGAILEGTVTLARPARHFHRAGQLRFLFQRVQQTDEEAVTMLASLYAIRTSEDSGIAVDEEGGARAVSPRTRFIAPALSLLALRVAAHRTVDTPEEPSEFGLPTQFEYGNPALGGFLGWGVAGVALSQVSQPIGIGLSIVGVVRTVYGSVFGKGREVVFPAHTPIQLQLAPAPAPPPASGRGKEP
jgi:hypothetical protein